MRASFQEQSGRVPHAFEERGLRGRRASSPVSSGRRPSPTVDADRSASLLTVLLLRKGLQRLDVMRLDREAGQPERDGVPEEDFRERLADHGADAVPHERLRRVLARGAAPEVLIDEQDRRARA